MNIHVWKLFDLFPIFCNFQFYRDIKALKVLEKAFGFKQEKCGSWKTCITMKKDIPEKEIEKHLQTPG